MGLNIANRLFPLLGKSNLANMSKTDIFGDEPNSGNENLVEYLLS